VAADGQPEPAFTQDPELHFEQTTWPGARLPHAWVFDDGNKKASTLDLCGRGRFTILTGIGGKAWVEAAETLSAELDLPISTHVIGPRQTWQDHYGDWARAREVADAGVILVRPDHHVAWRSEGMAAEPVGALRRVLKSILDR
ncbi:MAG: 2,4-dichlorophenol 6-monooxygenase, partial [Alphaproteobacteria bacterium]